MRSQRPRASFEVRDEEMVPTSGCSFGKRKEKSLAWCQCSREDWEEGLGLQNMEPKMFLRSSLKAGSCSDHSVIMMRSERETAHRPEPQKGAASPGFGERTS